jgi:hypothetical protein
MTKWEMPPLAKVYEALSAVADGRVKILDETSAAVLSSERDKTYTVKWSADGRAVAANDNATRWQGYIGYPIIAVLLATGRIAFGHASSEELAGVPWHAAVEQVLSQVSERGGNADEIREDVRRIYAALVDLGLERPEPKKAAGKKGA